MTRIMPLLLLALAACAAPTELAYPVTEMVVTKGERVYHVRAQRDPTALAWSTRVWSLNPPLTAADHDAVMAVVSDDVGASVCGGGRLVIGEGQMWNPLAGPKQKFNTGSGEWRLVGRCG